MSQTPIPFIFMRGGTSRGPYFNRADLPQNLDQLANVLISALGSGHALNIDGIGGGNAGRCLERRKVQGPGTIHRPWLITASTARPSLTMTLAHALKPVFI